MVISGAFSVIVQERANGRAANCDHQTKQRAAKGKWRERRLAANYNHKSKRRQPRRMKGARLPTMTRTALAWFLDIYVSLFHHTVYMIPQVFTLPLYMINCLQTYICHDARSIFAGNQAYSDPLPSCPRWRKNSLHFWEV